ncbi:MAG: tRNA (adenosine(37)-N6)-threonylcarbamoyltransferase complex dimerization subunit type 1 TsaB [Pseudomonadota bacterium]
MTTLLAVETSGPLCSLAIRASGRWFEDTQNVERLHNQVVLANLDALARAAGVHPRAFDAVAFGAGPGSFTGVRIAAAVAQGVAFACGARVAPISSSRALAATAAARHGRCGYLAVTRSRRDAYYLAGYSPDGGNVPEQRLDDRLHQGTFAPDWLKVDEWVGIGQRPPWWPTRVRFIDDVAVTARVVGELALHALERGQGLGPAAALPRYVQGDSPWRPAGT